MATFQFTRSNTRENISFVQQTWVDINACIGSEILNNILASRFYKFWCLYDQLQSPDEYSVRKGAEELVTSLKERLTSLLDSYAGLLKKQGVQDWVSFIREPTNYLISAPVTPVIQIDEQTIDNKVAFNLGDEGTVYDVHLIYKDGQLRTLQNVIEVVYSINDEDCLSGSVFFAQHDGLALEVFNNKLDSILLSVVPVEIASWLEIEMV